MKQVHRQARGNMLFIAVCGIAAILIPGVIILSKYAPFFAYSGRTQNVVDAAALIAATDLSRIVVSTDHFGYVSLSNHPPEGRATLAADGEPLPVVGINTLIGTLRQNAIIAEEIGNHAMAALVDRDVHRLAGARRDLECSLDEAVSGYSNQGPCVDMHGDIVDPVADVKAFLAQNLPPTIQVQSVQLKLGWLAGGSESTIPLPQPLQLSQVKGRARADGQYEAFVSYPVGETAFTFAGLGKQAHLVSARRFQEADRKHVASIVRIECTFICHNEGATVVKCVACAQPYCHSDTGMRGAMTLRFAGRPVAGLLSWNEFLRHGNFQDNRLISYDVVDGDYPYERQAKVHESWHDPKCGTTQEFAEHFYNWLRNGRLLPHIDAVVGMLNEPFGGGLNAVYTYEFADDGSIARTVTEGSCFARAVTADGQYTAMADTRVRSGASAVVIFRDNVSNLGAEDGKHGGQPLAGYPLGRVSGTVDHERLALAFSQRASQAPGLALDIEIGGTGESTAREDMIRMRSCTRSRRI